MGPEEIRVLAMLSHAASAVTANGSHGFWVVVGDGVRPNPDDRAVYLVQLKHFAVTLPRDRNAGVGNLADRPKLWPRVRTEGVEEEVVQGFQHKVANNLQYSGNQNLKIDCARSLPSQGPAIAEPQQVELRGVPYDG